MRRPPPGLGGVRSDGGGGGPGGWGGWGQSEGGGATSSTGRSPRFLFGRWFCTKRRHQRNSPAGTQTFRRRRLACLTWDTKGQAIIVLATNNAVPHVGRAAFPSCRGAWGHASSPATAMQTGRHALARGKRRLRLRPPHTPPLRRLTMRVQQSKIAPVGGRGGKTA